MCLSNTATAIMLTPLAQAVVSKVGGLSSDSDSGHNNTNSGNSSKKATNSSERDGGKIGNCDQKNNGSALDSDSGHDNHKNMTEKRNIMGSCDDEKSNGPVDVCVRDSEVVLEVHGNREMEACADENDTGDMHIHTDQSDERKLSRHSLLNLSFRKTKSHQFAQALSRTFRLAGKKSNDAERDDKKKSKVSCFLYVCMYVCVCVYVYAHVCVRE